MDGTPDIREGRPGDLAGIEKLYAAAFPDEDLWPLVKALLDSREDVLSLVAVAADSVAGHISFTFCTVEESDRRAALLAPLAVGPAAQNQGIGSALVRAGFAEVQKAAVDRVFVLGDPGYYRRFGFRAEDRVAAPYPLPAEWQGAWQSVGLNDAEAPLEGTLSVPDPWRDRALWAP